MLRVNARARSSWRSIANACGVSILLCSFTNGQTRTRPQELEARKDAFVDRVFLKCMDSSLKPPREEYFFGPIVMPTSTVAVPTVVEYDGAHIESTEDNSHQDADELNGESHGIVVMRVRALRTRSQGLTKPETPLDTFKTKPNGVWEGWTKWDDSKKGASFEIGYLKNEKGIWSMEVGPGLQPYGALAKLSNDVSGSQGSPYYLTVDKIATAKPPSCEAMFAMFTKAAPEDVQSATIRPQLPAAPGHSLNDTYEQAQTVAQGNASKGVRDSISPSYLRARLSFPVCYSIDATGNCQRSGEAVRLPGDLAQPLDWNTFQQPGACRPPQSDQIEIVLKTPLTENERKRYIRCLTAANLASVRKDLIDLGVKNDGQNARVPGSPSPVNAADAPRSSLPSVNSSALEIAPGKDAVTTRAFPDPRGRGPGCEIGEGTLVLVQSVDKQTGEVRLFVLPSSKRDSKTCTNFLTVDQSDLRAVAGNPSPK